MEVASGINKQVRYVNTRAGKDPLHENSVNIILYNSREERQLLNGDQWKYNQNNPDNKGLLTPPPLPVDLEVLLAYRFSNYLDAIRLYDLTIQHFYTENYLEIPQGDKKLRVSVLRSQLEKHNEIDLWSHFKTPGIPFLSWTLKFAMVPGKSVVLPAVQKGQRKTGTLSEPDAQDQNPSAVRLPQLLHVFSKSLGPDGSLPPGVAPESTINPFLENIRIELEEQLQSQFLRLSNSWLSRQLEAFKKKWKQAEREGYVNQLNEVIDTYLERTQKEEQLDMTIAQVGQYLKSAETIGGKIYQLPPATSGEVPEPIPFTTPDAEDRNWWLLEDCLGQVIAELTTLANQILEWDQENPPQTLHESIGEFRSLIENHREQVRQINLHYNPLSMISRLRSLLPFKVARGTRRKVFAALYWDVLYRDGHRQSEHFPSVTEAALNRHFLQPSK